MVVCKSQKVMAWGLIPVVCKLLSCAPEKIMSIYLSRKKINFAKSLVKAMDMYFKCTFNVGLLIQCITCRCVAYSFVFSLG